MKLPVTTSMPCVLVGRKEKEYEANGKKGVSYSLALVCDGEVANLPCNQIAYDKAGEFGEYSKVLLSGEFDTNYKNFKVVLVSGAETAKK